MSLMVKFGWPVSALLIVLFSTFTTTFLDIYSTAVSALNIFPDLGERKGVVLGGFLGTLTAILFPSLLNYEHFLLFIGAMFCPLFGVVLADYFLLRNGILHPEELYRKNGKYWFWKGVNPTAILSWSIGFFVYLGFSPILLDKVLGIKTSFPWDFGSSLPSMVLAAAIYWAISPKR
jgi:purine-cytosine permease-like protein